MVRRVHVETNHVGGFALEVGIVRLHVAFEAMRLQAGALPRFGDEIVMNLQHAAQLAGAPVCAAVRGRLSRLRQNAGFHGRSQYRRRLATIACPQPRDPIDQKPPAPAIDVVAVARHRGFDHRVRGPIGEQQHDARPARVLRSNFEAPDSAFQFGSFIGCQCQRHMARQGTSTASVSTGH